MTRIHAALLDGAAAACLCAACGGSMDGEVRLANGTCASGTCVSTIAGSGEFGTADGTAAEAQFFMPHALAMDAMAQLHVADFGSNNGTRIVAGGRVTTLAEDATAFPQPGDRATDAAGRTFVADTFANRILEVLPGGQTAVLAGTGESGDKDGDAATATFSMPSGLAFDADGALLVADMGSRKIRKITFAGARS